MPSKLMEEISPNPKDVTCDVLVSTIRYTSQNHQVILTILMGLLLG